MPEQRVAEHLRRLPLFSRLPEVELAELGDRVRTKQFKRGETIFRKDDPGTHLYMVLDGAVKIALPGEFDGRRRHRAHSHAGRARGVHRRLARVRKQGVGRPRAARDHLDPATPDRDQGSGAARKGDSVLMPALRKRPLVLVVEDDPALGDVIVSALKDDGLDAKLARDGDEAMRDVDDLSPAAMVLDLMMPRR